MPPPRPMSRRAQTARSRVVLGGALLLLASALALVALTDRGAHELDVAAIARRAHDTHDVAESPSARTERDCIERTSMEHAFVRVTNHVVARPDERTVVARGHVTLAGAPLAGAIDVLLCDADGRVLELSTTDARGEFELHASLPLERGWSVRTDDVLVLPGGVRRALAPDAAMELAEHTLADPPVALRLDVDFPAELAGRVVDGETGAPIESALVRVRAAAAAWELAELSTRSAADGRFRVQLDGLPARELVVDVRSEGRRPRVLGPLDPRAGTRALDVVLARPLAWRGRVVSARDGRPVRGATITIGSALLAPEEAACLDAVDDDGRFACTAGNVPLEGAWLHVAAPGFAPAVLHAEPAGEELSVALDAPVVLLGTVEADGASAAIEGAVVRVVFDGGASSSELELADEARAGADGAFELVLESAPFDAARIVVEAPDRVPFRARLADLVELDAERRARVRVELSRAP